MAVLDHLVYAVGDLEAGRRRFAEATGVTPALGGAHPGRGTHNALASLGGSYLELIAPDPAQPAPDGPWPFGLDTVDGDGLVAFAVRPGAEESIDDLVVRSGVAGHDLGDVISMSRRRPDGVELRWRNTVPPPVPGGVIPFVIDWGPTAMPSTTAPSGLELITFSALHPDPADVCAALAALRFDMVVAVDQAAGLVATLRGPKGAVTLTPASRTAR